MFSVKIGFYRTRMSFMSLFCLIALFLVGLSSPLDAQDCEAALEDALESLIEQNYGRIIVLLTECPPDRLVEPS